MTEEGMARVLVIDDDEGIRKVVATALQSEGYIVDTASSAKEAIDKSQSNFYNLALVDIRLPDMEGTKLLTALKETTPEMVKIILTGYPELQNAIDAVNHGASGYLIKPIKMDELIRTIKQHLEKQKELKEFGHDKLAKFVETRFKELQAQEFDDAKTEKAE